MQTPFAGRSVMDTGRAERIALGKVTFAFAAVLSGL